ncbi:MAG: signal peptidase I [Fusobacteriaceae bacterium]
MNPKGEIILDTKVLIINGIFYFVLTAFFIYILVFEKKIMAKINVHKDKFSDFLSRKFSINSDGAKKNLKKTVYFVESIVTAIILVLIIQRFYLGNFMVPTGSMIPTIELRDRFFANMVVYKFSKPERNDIAVFKEPIHNKVLYTKRIMGLPGENVSINKDRLFINDKEVMLRNYSNIQTNLTGKVWRVPKKGDTLKIVPAINYNQAYKDNNFDIAKIQKDLLANPGAVSEILPKLSFYVNGSETGMLLDFIADKNVVQKLMAGETFETVLDKDYYFALGDNTNNSLDSRYWGFVADNRIRGKLLFRFWPLNRIRWMSND